MKKKLTILYEDEDLLLIDKPAHCLSIPDRFKPELVNVKDLLQQQFGSIFTVHRLDKETSGIMVFARNEASHRHLSEQFETRTVDKQYWVLVQGEPQPAAGTIDLGIAPHPGKAGKMMISKKGKASLTLFRTLEVFRQCTLVEATIKTGRTHQIRVHFQALGHPLVVDVNYGGQEGFFLSTLKGKKYRRGKSEEAERPLMSRVSLHAKGLRLVHPRTQEVIYREAALPKDFKAVLSQLRKLA